MATTIVSNGRDVRQPRAPAFTPVTVNGVEIPRSAIAKEVQHHPADTPSEAWAAAARALVVREVLLQEARRLALVPEPATDAEGRRETDEEALIRQVVDTAVHTPRAGRDECLRVYEMQRGQFRSAPLIEARHILLAAPPGDPEERSRARERAAAILEDLRARPFAFEELAETYSACPSARGGGMLGQIHPGTTVPEFERALARAPVGEPMLTETRYGWHVVLAERRIEGRDLPFELAEPHIARWLEERVHRTAIQQFIMVLAGRASISGVDIRRAASPLVQ